MSDPLHVLNALVLEDGRRWGEAAAEFQREDAAAILDPKHGEPNMHYLTRGRGGSKTSDNAGIALAALLDQFGPGDQGYVFAVDSDQAGELVRAAGGFVQRTSELSGLVDVQTRRIVMPNSAAFNVVASDAASAFGLRGRFYIFDEFAQLKQTGEPRALWSAVFSAVPKVSGCRLVLLTTSGDPASWQARVLEQARESAAWRVHEVPGPVPWVSAADLVEQRRMLTESQYRRLHMNEWVAPEDRLSTVDDVRACVTHSGVLEARRGVRYLIGVDLGVKSDRTVIAVCHAEPGPAGPTVVLDRMEVFTPGRGVPVDLAVVEEAIVQASQSYGRADVLIDPWQALLLAENLRRRRVNVDEFTFSQTSVGRLALNLYRLLRDRRLALPDDDELLTELAQVRIRETSPGVFRLDHDADKHDDRAIALGIASLELAAIPQDGPTRTSARATSPLLQRATPGAAAARPKTYADRVAFERRHGTPPI